MLSIETLYHGGIMVNYECNASCRHCLYSCSPTRNPGYIDEETADKICTLLNKGKCCSVHIGGGEPFLNFDGLLMMVRALNKAGITLEYIETNASWVGDVSDLSKGAKQLESLLKEDVDTLCISIDPYHAEYVPYGAPLTLAELCKKTGMGYFLWKHEFLSQLSHLNPSQTHTRKDIEKTISENYVLKTARLYGISYGGRAVNIEKEFKTLYPVEKFAIDDSSCEGLLSTSHFHVDKDGFFIPPRCTGILLPLDEMIDGIPGGKYHAFEALYYGGVSALFNLALRHGFYPDHAGYPSKCNLCFHLRRFLSQKNDFTELDSGHYEEALMYYKNYIIL